MPNSMETRTAKLAAMYADARSEGKPGWMNDYADKRKSLDGILGRPGIPQSGKFLDLGCGAGNVTLYAAEKGYEAYGIDIVPAVIEWARKNSNNSGLTAHFKVGAAARLNSCYDPDFFDIVYDSDCFVMILRPDRAACFRSVFNVTKPGGYFRTRAHLAYPDIKEPRPIKSDRYYEPETRTVIIDGVPIYQYSLREEFEQEIKAAGFQIGKTWVFETRPGEHPALAARMWIDAWKPQ